MGEIPWILTVTAILIAFKCLLIPAYTSTDFEIAVCALYSFRSPRLVDRIPRKLRQNGREACFVLLASLQALLICDSIHFQYNSMLTGIFLLSMYFIDSGRLLMAALTFSVLLNFKHIYVYYALGYVFYYLVNYFQFSPVEKILGNVPKAILLAVSLLLPFAISIFPFFHASGIQGLQAIATRLFPVSRGLTHAFWAPNFWALYNFTDLVLYRILSLLRIGKFEAPSYTSGLVQEYAHSVLPNVTPVGTLCLVVISSLAVLTGLVIRWRRDSRPADFSLFAVFSALSFFYFGYHVHEKAIILITVPMTIFAIKDPKYHRHLVHLTCVSSFSLFPLLFTEFEILLKYTICLAYFVVQLVVLKRYTRMPLSDLLPWRHVASWVLLGFVEFYNTFLHKWLLSSRLPFAPLMAISVLTAIELTAFFGSLIWHTFADGLLEITWQKGACRIREQLIRDSAYSVQTVEEEQDVQLVAGVDISASLSNSDMVFVSVSFWDYPQGTHVATVSDTRCLKLPYIPQYLAVREAEVMADFVRKVIAERPELRPDVLLCDGFGQFHSRDCGMACHVGALTGIPTIGVAKNLTLHDTYEAVGMKNKAKVDQFLDSCRQAHKNNKTTSGYIPFDIVEPTKLNILRIGASMSGVFVSAGYGIELDLATVISSRLLQNNTTCEPIRAADLESRRLVREYFDGNDKKTD
ncbi:hypothetical protein CAEBREN_21094 [Caenorhabditis brenneri]|uniref:Alpha-1,3-glucosyltransferase n=1 Tax=Caenorhabditis brenneri TaxID=135651 RepID=G0NNX1_CAEBE|nr:hypothetical protein CAEBREN_21094 [Caenorhabditis brenneri]